MISNAKLKQFEQMPQRESIHHRFKESSFWDFCDGLSWKDDCNGYHYFDRIIDKYIDKPFSHVIHKCRTHKSYNHRNGFKRQVNERIREYMRRPELKRYTYSGSSNYEGEYFVDMDGILRKIEDLPDYFIIPFVERVAWRDWQDPTRITTTSRKRIRKIKGIHYFVSSFDQVKFIYKSYLHGIGVGKKILNPDFYEIPLTKSQLQMYRLVNDPEDDS